MHTQKKNQTVVKISNSIAYSKIPSQTKNKTLKLSAKMNLKYTSMQISINFCLKYFFIFCLICKNEKQIFLNLYKK